MAVGPKQAAQGNNITPKLHIPPFSVSVPYSVLKVCVFLVTAGRNPLCIATGKWMEDVDGNNDSLKGVRRIQAIATAACKVFDLTHNRTAATVLLLWCDQDGQWARTHPEGSRVSFPQPPAVATLYKILIWKDKLLENICEILTESIIGVAYLSLAVPLLLNPVYRPWAQTRVLNKPVQALPPPPWCSPSSLQEDTTLTLQSFLIRNKVPKALFLLMVFRMEWDNLDSSTWHLFPEFHPIALIIIRQHSDD
ncbi:hypothetical protein BTVI_06356 [Pitangus sulphuratus]|nr:hypothetical protein BTVI_06356 [Pitangus sulphuratus]